MITTKTCVLLISSSNSQWLINVQQVTDNIINYEQSTVIKETFSQRKSWSVGKGSLNLHTNSWHIIKRKKCDLIFPKIVTFYSSLASPLEVSFLKKGFNGLSTQRIQSIINNNLMNKIQNLIIYLWPLL